MIKTFMLLLAFTVTDPSGEVRDESHKVFALGGTNKGRK